MLRNGKYNNLSSSKFSRCFPIFLILMFSLTVFLGGGKNRKWGEDVLWISYVHILYFWLLWRGRAYIFIFRCTSFCVFCFYLACQSDPFSIHSIFYFWIRSCLYLHIAFLFAQAFCSSVLYLLFIFIIIIIIYFQLFFSSVSANTSLSTPPSSYLRYKCVCFRCFLYFEIILVFVFISSNFQLCSHNLCAFFMSFVSE